MFINGVIELMALFRRNKTKPVVLPELEKYYDAERRERSGLAWLLALVSIAGVALVLIGMFLGGRWLYRTLTTDEKPKTAVVQNNNKTNDEKKSSGTTTPKSDNKTGTSNQPATKTTPVPSSSTPQVGNPSTGTTSLTNTGPESVIPYFVLATIFGTLLYRSNLRKTLR